MLTRIRFPILLLALMLAFSPVTDAGDDAATVLVVPNRYTIVQLAFNMAQMRTVKLIAYEKVRKTGELLMHIWSPMSREWLKTDIKEYGTGTLIAGPVERVIVIGGQQTFPTDLVTASSWCEQVESLDSLDIVTLLNALNTHFAFTPREWRRLAKLYGLKLRDKNEERRRYGRYGKPGEKRDHPVPPKAGRRGEEGSSDGTAEGAVEPGTIEEKGVPAEAAEPEPVIATDPEKETALEKTEKKEEEPLPEDK